MRALIKFILSLAFLVILVAALVGVYFYARRTSILSHYLSEKMGVSVHIDSVDISTDKITLNGLNIANPKGYSLPSALKIQTLSFNTPVSEYFKKEITVNNVTLSEVLLGVEFKDKSHTHGNWTEIIGNLDTNYSTTQAPDESAKKKSSGFRHDRTVRINQLLILNTTVQLQLAGEPLKTLSPIAKMEFQNVTSEKGLPIEEITEIIIRKLIDEASILQGFSRMVLTAPGSAAKAALSPFKVLFGN